MIISASRRTDIPKFYADWFYNRVLEGYCTYPNPFDANKVNVVSLRREDVDVFVFWSKDPKPLMRYLSDLDNMSYNYYFQFTINGYMKIFEPNLPPLIELVDTFRELSDYIGPDRVIWRYDPIIMSNVTSANYHYKQFYDIAGQLKGYTKRVIISLLDDYRGSGSRLKKLLNQNIQVDCINLNDLLLQDLLKSMAYIARDNNMAIQSCAEGASLIPLGIMPGKCVDEKLIKTVFGIEVSSKKDPSQRLACGCVVSKDIGIYDTCGHDCVYCYAAGSSKVKGKHDPNSPSLIGRYEANTNNADKHKKQGKLF